MTSRSTKEERVKLFDQVWRQCRKECCSHPCGGDCSICRPAPHLASRLIELVASEPEKPIEAFKPVIERMLQESRYPTAGAGTLMPDQKHPPIGRQAELVVTTLKRMASADKPACRRCATCETQARANDAGGAPGDARGNV